MSTKTVRTSVFDDGKVYTSCRQEFGFAGFGYISSTVKKKDNFSKFSIFRWLQKELVENFFKKENPEQNDISAVT